MTSLVLPLAIEGISVYMDMRVCEECGVNPATVHLTQIIQDETHVSHLCGECAGNKGISISIEGADVIPDMAPMEQMNTGPDVQCPQCTLSLNEFRETGRLGCPHCYQAFEKEINQLQLQMHGASSHSGKQYGTTEAGKLATKDVVELRTELDKAIRSEKFELAASIRDKIKSIVPGNTMAKDHSHS